MTKDRKNFTAEKKFNFLISKNTIYLSLFLQKPSALKREHPNHEISKKFKLLWVIFALLDPGSETLLKTIKFILVQVPF
jgi:hypothetical protein